MFPPRRIPGCVLNVVGYGSIASFGKTLADAPLAGKAVHAVKLPHRQVRKGLASQLGDMTYCMQILHA